MENIPAASAPLDRPTAFMRWCGVMPMLTFFVSAALLSFDAERVHEIFNALKVDLPSVTLFSLAFMEGLRAYFYLIPPLMFGILFAHHAWVGKEYRRLIWFNALYFLISTFMIFALSVGTFLPLIMIQEALRKK